MFNVITVADALVVNILGNIKLQSKSMKPIAYNIEGKAGIGKTASISISKAKLEAMGYTVSIIQYNLGELEFGDLNGALVPELEMKNSITGVTSWYPKEFITCLNDDHTPTGKYRTNVGTPLKVQKALNEYNTSPNPMKHITIMFLDDANRGVNQMNQAVMRLCDQQELDGFKLPPNSTVVLSMNPSDGTDDMYMVTEWDGAQKTRYTTLKVCYDLTVHKEWLRSYFADADILHGFFSSHQELFNGTRVSNGSKGKKGESDSASILDSWKVENSRHIDNTLSACYAYFKDGLIAPTDGTVSRSLDIIRGILSDNINEACGNAFRVYYEDVASAIRRPEEFLGKDKEFSKYVKELRNKNKQSYNMLFENRVFNLFKEIKQEYEKANEKPDFNKSTFLDKYKEHLSLYRYITDENSNDFMADNKALLVKEYSFFDTNKLSSLKKTLINTGQFEEKNEEVLVTV
jgi:hypothetical protein